MSPEWTIDMRLALGSVLEALNEYRLDVGRCDECGTWCHKDDLETDIWTDDEWYCKAKCAPVQRARLEAQEARLQREAGT